MTNEKLKVDENDKIIFPESVKEMFEENKQRMERWKNTSLIKRIAYVVREEVRTIWDDFTNSYM